MQDHWLAPGIDLGFRAVTSVDKPIRSVVRDLFKLDHFVLFGLTMALLTFSNLEVEFLLDRSEVLENVFHLRQ